MTWGIEITNFLGGFSPRYYGETYPSYGNKNNAGSMLNCDLTNAGYMTQGPGLTNLTNGTQAAAVTTLVKSIIDSSVENDVTYGIGGNLLYKLSSTAVTSDGTWPHTIDKGTVTGEDGEDVAFYKSYILYSYNHSGSAGDIGKYIPATGVFDDDYFSTVPTGKAALQTGPHQIAVGGNDVVYIANGRYVASWDDTTFIPQALDLPQDAVIVSIVWMADKVWIAANRPNLTGSNKNISSIYVWDGTTDSWEAEIRVTGEIGGLFVKNGVLYFFYRDVSSTGGHKLAYFNGSSITDLANFAGSLPAFYQITDYQDFILWLSDNKIYAWGSGDKDLPVRLFQLAGAGNPSASSIAAPFGTPIMGSKQTGTPDTYRLAQFDDYTVDSNWKSLIFDITGSGAVSKIEKVRINFEQLASGARVDWSLKNNKGETIYSDTISYAKLGAATSAFYPLNGKVAENFRWEADFTNGSTTAPVKIRNVKIYGSSN